MADREAGQKKETSGSTEAEFQGGQTWAGIYETPRKKGPYFYSYLHFGIHEEIINDPVRINSYMNAIMNNPQLSRARY